MIDSLLVFFPKLSWETFAPKKELGTKNDQKELSEEQIP